FCLAASAPAAALPVFFADNHAETFGWVLRTFDPDLPLTMVLVDAHSDAAAAERSEQIREEARRVPDLAERARRVESWRAGGRIQCQNWIEPLLPRPFERVLWVARPQLKAKQRDALQRDAVEFLDARLEVEPRGAQSFAARWRTLDLAELEAWRPELEPVVLAIDLDFFAGHPEASALFARVWRAAMDWPGLAGVAFAISRPWLTDNAEADRLVAMAVDAVMHTRGTRVDWDLSVDDRPDGTQKAKDHAAAGRPVPRWDVARAAPAIRAALASRADRWELHDRARKVDASLLGSWPQAAWQVDGLEADDDGVYRFPAGRLPEIRIALNEDAGASGRVRWSARVPERVAYDVLPQTGLGKAFAKNAGRWVHEVRRPLAKSAGPSLAPAAWQELLDAKTGAGRVRIEAEWEKDGAWFSAGVLELRAVEGEGFRAGLSECFGMPYVFGIALMAENGRHGVETGWGSDCSNFLIHAWRRAGVPLEWGDPGRLRAGLETVAEKVTAGNPVPINDEMLQRGLAIDFGNHVAALWDDTEPRGV
ncbi:MAG: hypothetical protein ACKO39_15265, partial [Chthoniobacterales bacterium]